jgi:hypothetical protein
MRHKLRAATVAMIALIVVTTTAVAADPERIDPEALIEQILTVYERQHSQIEDITFDAEYVEGEQSDEGFVEKVRLIKTIYIKYTNDSALYREEFHEYYKDGELQPEKELEKEAKERIKRRMEHNQRTAGHPMLEPFFPDQRDDYDITYEGVNYDDVEGYICHEFLVRSQVEDGDHVNGTYYFDADSFRLVRCDFSPAKLVKKTFFRLNNLDMTIEYGFAADSTWWLPTRFELEGSGKAAIFFGVNFSGTEYFRNPRVNTGLADSLFEVDHD